MCRFCDEIENNPKYKNHRSNCHAKVKEFAEWYRKQYSDYSEKLRTELWIQSMCESIDNSENKVFDISSTISAKLSYFVVSDALVKLLLSKFSYGPNSDFLNKYGINLPLSSESWFECKNNESAMAEILAKVLKQEDYQPLFDLQALFSERYARNQISHRADKAICFSAMRSYNSIREMIIFLNSEFKDKLPKFLYDDYFNFDDFSAKIDGLDFAEYTTILIVDSIHDVKYDERKTVANLPWDIVIDFDGYSDHCGLLKSVEHNHIQKESVINRTHQLINGNTLWYRCGDYQIPYNNYNGLVNGYKEFKVPEAKIDKYASRLSKAFEIVIDKAIKLERKLLFIAVTNDFNVVDRLLHKCDEEIEDYVCVWIGMSDEQLNSEYKESFFHISAPTHQFYQEIHKRKGMFNAFLEQRKSGIEEFLLVTTDGEKCIPENYRHKLALYFDVLYKGCEKVKNDTFENNKRNFYKGGLATWDVIADSSMLILKRDNEINKIINDINTGLGQLNDNAEKRIFFLEHTPGFGGTTLARQIAWKLHTKHPVLSVEKYDSVNTIQLLKDIYSNVLDKSPFILRWQTIL